MFSGSIVALAVPFAGRAVDERSLADFVSWQIRRGAAALAVNTAMGEGQTLSADERLRVISLVRKRAGRVPVIAAICTSCTAQGVEEAGRAKAAGASALLVTAPPYSRPTPAGVLCHLEAIAGATNLPVVIQNDPSRTGVALGPASLARLAALPSVIGFVDASGDLALGLPACRRKSLAAYTTQDAMAAPFAMAGGAGTISALANITPRLCADMHLAIRRGAFAEAAGIQRRLFSAHRSPGARRRSGRSQVCALPLARPRGSDAAPSARRRVLHDRTRRRGRIGGSGRRCPVRVRARRR